MKAIICNGTGSVEETLTLKEDVPIPELRDEDVLVKVKATAFNPVDCKVRSGMKGGNENSVIGWDASGVIEKVGPKADGRFKVGDEVMFSGDIGRSGSYAEYVAVDSRIVGKKPKNASWEKAAALPLVSITAWEAFFDCLSLPEGEQRGGAPTVLIINGAGGVGSIGTQLAKKIMKATVVATASRDETIAHCKKMGADHVINHHKNFKEQLSALNIDGVDVIFCCVDLDLHWASIVEVANTAAKIVGITVKPDFQIAPMSLFFPKRLTLAFEFMFGRPAAVKNPEFQGELLDKVADLVDSGEITVPLTNTLNGLTVENIKKAHDLLESGKAIGKQALVL